MPNTVIHLADMSIIKLDRGPDTPEDINSLACTVNEVMAKDTRCLALDFSRISIINSNVVGVLVRMAMDLKEKDKVLVLYGIKGRVREFIDVLGMDKLFEIHEEEAPT